MSLEHQREEIIVREHLAELRGRVRLLTWVSGLSWTILVLFGGLLVSGLSDWMIHFDDPGLRLVIGLSLLIASGVMAWRQLIRPLLQPLTTSFLAQRIEHRFPGLHSRVLSAVEFLQHRMDARIGSPEMQKAVVLDALRDLERIEPRDIVETKAIKRVTIAGAILSMLIGTVVVLHPIEAATSLKRLMFPFANCPWPRQFELMLVRNDMSPVIQAPDRPLLIARGDTLEMYVINQRGRLPERIWFEHRMEDDQAVEREPLRQTSLRDTSGRSHEAAVISWIATRGVMQFRVTGGDDDTMTFLRVEVVQPPTLESLRVTVTPPPYSGRSVETLPQGVGHVQGLLRTEISIVATSDKPLKSARLRVADKPPIPLTVADDGVSFTASLSIVDPGVTGYWFELMDEAGFIDPEAPRFELRGVVDSVPEVLIESPVADIMLAPDAELPIKVLAKDDLGMREVRLSYLLNDSSAAKIIPLVTAPTDANAPLLISTPDYLWKLEEMGLEPGNRIVVRAEATDGYDLGPEPHVGRSTPRTITIVTKEAKQKELAGRVGDLLEDLQQAAVLQKRARQQTSELQMQLQTAGELRPQDVDQLNRIELDQRQAESRLNRPADGVQSQARQLLEEFSANKLEDVETGERLTRIIESLSRLGREQFPEIESALTRAAKQVDERLRDADSKPEEGSETKGAETKEAESKGNAAKGAESRESAKNDKANAPSQETTQPANEATDTKPDGESSAEKPKTDPAKPGPRPTKPEPSPLENSLTDAQTHQTRALETLQDLQDLLSQWRDQRDVSKELSSLIAEQERIQKDSAKLGQETVSKSTPELSPQEKADLGKMAARQLRIAEQVEAFRKQLQQAADGLKKQDPEAAERLEQAREELGTDGTAGKLREAADKIADNQMGTAAQAQQAAMSDLQDLDKQLKREPTDDVEALVKQIEQALQEFETLRKEQLDLKDMTQKVAGQPNSPQKTEDLAKLRQRQKDFTEKLAQAERKLERLRLRQPTEAAERAQERLDRVAEKLQDPEQMDDAGEEMQQVADELEQVQRELSLEKRFAQERLAMEELEKIEDQLKALVKQQEGVISETERLETERAQRGSLSRAQLRTLKDLADVERGLQGDAENMEKSLKVAEVFSLVLRRLSRSFKLAADRLSEKETDATVVSLEKDALKKIESLLLVLKPDDPADAKPQPPPDGTAPKEQPEKPQEAGPPGESLPQVAQLKLLKALQEEFLERTLLLDTLRDKDGKLSAAAIVELETLAREQSELADMTRNLVAKMLHDKPDKKEADDEKDEAKPEEGDQPEQMQKKRSNSLDLDDLDDKSIEGDPKRGKGE